MTHKDFFKKYKGYTIKFSINSDKISLSKDINISDNDNGYEMVKNALSLYDYKDDRSYIKQIDYSLKFGRNGDLYTNGVSYEFDNYTISDYILQCGTNGLNHNYVIFTELLNKLIEILENYE